MRVPSSRWLPLVTVVLAACGASPAMKAARSGDVGRLKAEIARERGRGALDRSHVGDLAQEVGERELRTSRGNDAILRIEEARSCTYPLADTLEARARSSDDAGATAMLVLLDGRSSAAGSIDREDLVRRYRESQSPLWRAVAARADKGAPGTARVKFLADPDERVRLAALRAALEDPHGDTPALLETARLDPNPLAKSLAVRAAGARGGGDVVLALKDLYGSADEDLRQVIVEAWASPSSAAEGGRRELIRVAESDLGPAGIGAAAAILRSYGAAPRAVDDAAGPLAVRVLARGIREGIAKNRLLAIHQAPLAARALAPDLSPLLEALARASQSEDEAIRAAALGRLAELPAKRAEALASLRAAASRGSRAALFALARAKDKSAVEGLTRETLSGDRQVRLDAGRALIDADALDRAADLLADSDPHVRMSASCALLVASRHKGGL